MKESLINKDLNLLIMPMDVIKLNFHIIIWNNPQQHTDGHPSATNQIQLLEKQLTAVPAELHNANEELKISKQEVSATIQTINDLKAQAQNDIDNCRKLAQEQLALGLELFSLSVAPIKFYTGFPTYKHLLVFCEFVKPNAERLVYNYALRDRQIHMLSVSRKVTTWANLPYFILGSQCIWPSKNEVQWNCNKPVSLLAFNNNTTNQIKKKIYCSRRAWY